jgi:hypothetical protein
MVPRPVLNGINQTKATGTPQAKARAAPSRFDFSVLNEKRQSSSDSCRDERPAEILKTYWSGFHNELACCIVCAE